jgi:hypothetical protein
MTQTSAIRFLCSRLSQASCSALHTSARPRRSSGRIRVPGRGLGPFRPLPARSQACSGRECFCGSGGSEPPKAWPPPPAPGPASAPARASASAGLRGSGRCARPPPPRPRSAPTRVRARAGREPRERAGSRAGGRGSARGAWLRDLVARFHFCFPCLICDPWFKVLASTSLPTVWRGKHTQKRLHLI